MAHRLADYVKGTKLNQWGLSVYQFGGVSVYPLGGAPLPPPLINCLKLIKEHYMRAQLFAQAHKHQIWNPRLLFVSSAYFSLYRLIRCGENRLTNWRFDFGWMVDFRRWPGSRGSELISFPVSCLQTPYCWILFYNDLCDKYSFISQI